MSQTTQRFSSETPPIHHLIQEIDMGTLGLPDLQRPFVWKRSRIRDLFDWSCHALVPVSFEQCLL